MKHLLIRAAACLSIGIALARADEPAGPALPRLPPPLGDISWSLGVLEKHFQVAECKYYAVDEFTAGGRVVAEETVVWTLEAKEALRASAVFELLHPNPSPSPFFKVRFFRSEEGKEVAADARTDSYALIRDGRWIGPKTGPDLAKGDKLQVWVHLGKEGSAGLIEQKASKMVVTAK